mmetsp:Transcript_70152/g.198875  ORF Transcript_70152/g.198875 Transcript_70152/m.198875 type:complete len:221 (-) Transcript_70152:871-1533(-)
MASSHCRPAGSKEVSCSSSLLRPLILAASRSNVGPRTPVSCSALMHASRSAPRFRLPLPGLSSLSANASISGWLALPAVLRPRSNTWKPRTAYFSNSASVRCSPRTMYFSGRATMRPWRMASRALGAATKCLPSKPTALQSMSVVYRRCAGVSYGTRLTCTFGTGLWRRLFQMQTVMECGVRSAVLCISRPSVQMRPRWTNSSRNMKTRFLKASPRSPTT